MSLDLIDHKLTTSTTDKDGVIWWSNPAVNVKINSKGQVFKYDELYEGFSKIKERTIKYSITILNEGLTFYAHVSFNTLFSRTVLGLKLGVKTLRLRDHKIGYTKDNIILVHNSQGFKRSTSAQENIAVTVDLSEICKDSGATAQKQFYTVYEAKNEHTTEDGAVFPTKELAEWHQDKVSKGKGNAQVVLDYNGGYVLAEQIYLQEVVYNKAKPYANFIDVLNNNKGIVSNVQEEHCKFDKLDNEHGLSTVQLNLFGLDKVINLPCTKLQAEKINTSLNKYSEAFSKLEDEHKTLKDLLKQVS